ncbi:MAG: Pterin-4-alpha-carbinolamine dehydratase, partial [uncultured Gemmatimonadetes bacterium]
GPAEDPHLRTLPQGRAHRHGRRSRRAPPADPRVDHRGARRNPAAGARVHLPRLRRRAGVHESRGRHRRRRRPSSRPADGVGARHRRLVDPRHRRAAPQRLHHGRQDGRGVLLRGCRGM